MRYASHAMQGLSQAVQQHEQLLGVLRARLLGSEPCPAPAIPGRIVGMCMRYQQSVAAMMKDGAPVSLTGAFPSSPVLAASTPAVQTNHIPVSRLIQRMPLAAAMLRPLQHFVTPGCTLRPLRELWLCHACYRHAGDILL